MRRNSRLSLFDELRRRHVFRAATWYAASAWLIIQVASTVVPQFDLPAWVVRAVIVAALTGFPVAILLAWAFDLTRSGLKLTAPTPTARATTTPARSLLSLALAVATGILLGVGALTGWHALDLPAEKPGIAVLAFDPLGQADNRALAGGLQEAVLDELAHLSGLRVIARTSVLQFADTKPDLREVGRILDVPYVLEGSVQREGGKLRVHAQLIDAATNEHLWSQSYDRAADDIFGMQTALAQDIAAELKVKLLPQELARADAPPTAVPAAYDAFLSGLGQLARHEEASSGGRDGLAPLQSALRAMDKALVLDPGFARAHAERARMLMHLWFEYRDSIPEASRAREQALLAATEALRLAPGLGEAHRALGLYYYWGLFDYPSADRELALARKALPNDSASAWILGLVRRRQNRFDEALDLLHEAHRLNPADVSARDLYAETLYDMGQYAEADKVLADLLARFPEAQGFLYRRALLSFCRTGDTIGFRELADSGLAGKVMEDYSRWLAALYEQRFDEALAIIRAGSGDEVGLEFGPLELAESYYYANDTSAAIAAAQVVIAEIERQARAEPDRLAVYRGLPDAYFFAGEADKARQAARTYLDTTPLDKSALEYWEARQLTARTYAALGDREEALELLALVQNGPSHDCGNQLRRDPMYATLRGDPRFEQIAAGSDWK
jgi:TolB-like protein